MVVKEGREHGGPASPFAVDIRFVVRNVTHPIPCERMLERDGLRAATFGHGRAPRDPWIGIAVDEELRHATAPAGACEAAGS